MNQRTRGLQRRLMYLENKEGDIDGKRARIGWVEFSRSGRSVYYRGRTLASIRGSGVTGNFRDVETNEEYWVSGVKRDGKDALHWQGHIAVVVDEDAREEYEAFMARK